MLKLKVDQESPAGVQFLQVPKFCYMFLKRNRKWFEYARTNEKAVAS